MGTAELTNIIVTIAIAQVCCDLLANRFVYSQESYQRACAVFSRAKFNLKKLEANNSSTTELSEKQQRKLQAAQNVYSEAAADVARRHQIPGFCSSLVFVILYRILSTEYYGKVVAVLPFVPFSFLRRMTQRGMNFTDPDALSQVLLASSTAAAAAAVSSNDDPTTAALAAVVSHPHQACGFLFIYVLCTMAIKFITSHAIAVKPPQGADGGYISTMMDTPSGRRAMESWGIDPDAWKQD